MDAGRTTPRPILHCTLERVDQCAEAIAVELERSYAFIFISDERVTAAVNVSTDEDENYLIASDDEFSALGLANADYRGAFADYVGEDGGSGDD